MAHDIYEVEYECSNCGTKTIINVQWGTHIPVYAEEINDVTLGKMLSPECDYCGCRGFRHGKKPEY